jgi:inner membrane protein
MDNLTHTFTGVALSHTGLNRKTRFATLALVLASNAPDADIVTRIRSSAAYFEYHRGITHSLVGASVLAVILAALIYFPGRRARPKASAPPVSAKWLFFLCWIGVGGHLLLDYTNAYGVRLLLPFSGHWYAWDVMPILDLILWLIFAAGLGLPALLRLVSEEVGARKTSYRRGAVFALAAMVLLWGLRDINHRRALAQLASNNYADEPPVRYGAFPEFSPFRWKGVVETDSAFHILEVNALASTLDSEHTEMFRKPEPSPPLAAALKTHLGRVFINFARFPWAQVGEDQDGYEVDIRDLRFGNGSPGVFEATIDLDHEFRSRSESFSFMGRQR